MTGWLDVRFVAVALSAVLAASVALVVTSPGVSEAAHHQVCFADDTGDVHVLGTNAPAAEPRADIVEVCAEYQPTSLTFSARVAQPTNPASDPAWQQGDALLLWTIQDRALAYGGPAGQVALTGQDGGLDARAAWYDDQTPVCPGTASFDGTWYRASFDPTCLDVPATISFSAYLQYDVDPAAAGPGSVRYDTAPEGHGREGEGRFAGPLTRAGVTPPADRLAGRFAGPTRIDTAVEISRSQFPRGAEEVYLARQDAFPDALAAGSLTRGPTLLVPQCGPLPQVVGFEIERLNPRRVIALGGSAAICEQLLLEARDR
jgi:hypothetical protein